VPDQPVVDALDPAALDGALGAQRRLDDRLAPRPERVDVGAPSAEQARDRGLGALEVAPEP
jgi:hypothetical protein